jgi:hypothetical protein
MRDGMPASKAKLKRRQIQDRAHEDLIGDITCSVDSIGPKASVSLMLIVAISTSMWFFYSTTPFC